MPTADDRWSLPEPGSRYPLALLGRGIEPEQASVRFFGILAVLFAVIGYSVASVSVNQLVEWLGWPSELERKRRSAGTAALIATRLAPTSAALSLVPPTPPVA